MSSLSAPLARLSSELSECIRRRDRGRLIADLLASYARSHEDWRDFAVRDADGYTRNLLELNEEFELLLLCWGSGRTSPVHNHEGQDCWMVVLEGPIEEAHYAFPDQPGPLAPRRVQSYATGDVAFIRDEIGLHQVRSPGGRFAASLHLYSKPFATCNCYCERTGRVTRVPLVYHSVRGVPVTAS